MAWIFYSIIILVFSIIDAGNLINFLAVTELNIKPELMAVIMAILISYSSNEDAIGIAFFAGFMADVSGTSIGPCMIAYGIAGTLYSRIRGAIQFDQIRFQVLIIFFITLLVLMISEPLILWKTADSMPRMPMRILATALFTAITGPFIWQPAEYIRKLLGMPQRQTDRRF
jgi:rod shape-determining protein MreD